MKHLRDFVTFRRMIAPLLLQIMFWPAVAASIYYSAWIIVRGNPIGWIPLIVGTLFVRVIFEILMLFFRMHERLTQIHEALIAHEGPPRPDPS